jgi:ribose transport system ATP-binding protein
MAPPAETATGAGRGPGSGFCVRNISKRFGATRALRGVSLEARSGTVHALVGGNGSGKSTLIKILAGVLPADSGEIVVRGRAHDARAFSPSSARGARFHFVHQQGSMFPDLSVMENLAIGRGFERGSFGRIRWRAMRRRSREVLDKFEVPADPDGLVRDLSRATQALVAIARALQDTDTATGAVLVLDEPTAALPAKEVNLLLDALVRHARAGHTVLYVTHRLEEVSRVADWVSVLRNGVVAGVLDHPAVSREEVLELMIGRRLEVVEEAPRPPAPRGAVVLDVSDLAGGKIRSASFALHAGEIIGIAGLLGSGRSSILRMLFGVAPMSAGNIRMRGEPVLIRSPSEARAAGIAYVPEDRSEAAFESLSVLENITMPSLSEYWRMGRLHSRLERDDARNASRTFHVKSESIDALLGTLSGGNQQKALLARWLRRRPSVILLDEPTQGVDLPTRVEIYTLLQDAVRNGAAVLVVSSEFEELEALCDRVLILRQGRIFGEVDRQTLRDRWLEEPEYRTEPSVLPPAW